MKLIIAVVIVFIVLLASETWWRRKAPRDEFSRKLVHIIVGSFVAFWPFFLSWNQIKLLSLAFLVVVVISKQLHIFKAIHSVQRPTWGEIYFALAVGAIAFIAPDKWIYMASLLLMSVADGLAAVIGVTYGKVGRYRVWGQTKSVIGTLTFFIVAMVILFAYSRLAPGETFSSVLVVTAVLATVIENLASKGLDNLLVPVLAGCLLTIFR